MNTLNDNEKVVIDGKTYEYCGYYKRLSRVYSEDPSRGVMCPECHGTQFEISYGDYECIATCKCGHKMTVYDG